MKPPCSPCSLWLRIKDVPGDTYINATAESPDLNPYAPPVTVTEKPFLHGTSVRALWLRRAIGLQAIVMVASLAVEAYAHESIVGSGPIFALVGLVIAILAIRNRDAAGVVFGVSAIAFTSLIVFLINYNSWAPAQGDRPITILAFTYAAFALPISIWLVIKKRHVLHVE